MNTINKNFILLVFLIGGIAFAFQVWPTLYWSNEWYSVENGEMTHYELVKNRINGKVVRQVKVISHDNLPMEMPWNGKLPKGAKEFGPELLRAFLSFPWYLHFSIGYCFILIISLVLGEFILIGQASKMFKIIAYSMGAGIAAFAFGAKYFL